MRFTLSLFTIALWLSVGHAQGNAAWKPETADLQFSSTRDRKPEVYVLPAGQEDWVDLSNHRTGYNWPAWSPDGKKIAFQSNRAGNLDIWTMNADATEQVQLIQRSEPDYLSS